MAIRYIGKPHPFSPVKSFKDVENLDAPDPFRDGLMGPTLEVYRFMRYKHPNTKISMPVWVRGPFTLACLLTDGLPIGGYFTKKRVNRILEWIDRKPDVVHSLVEKCTKTIMRWIKAQRDVMGWDREFRLADDLVAYITPEQFKEFALPYLRRIYSELDHPLNVYHNCHYSNHLLKLIPETKAHIFHTGPPKNCDFFKAKELIGNQICLMGNISCYELPMKTVNEVERECKEVIQKCAPGGGFILSSSTSILPGTPHENIDVIIDSAEKYGKYPIFESL